jgi:hypothetical protein
MCRMFSPTSGFLKRQWLLLRRNKLYDGSGH